jgi:hypothetical protein
VLAALPKALRKSEHAKKAQSELAAKMLEHGRDHWPRWTNDRLTQAAKGSPPGTLAVAFTDPKRVENLLNDLKRQWIPRNREKGFPISIVLTGLTDDTRACCQKTGFTEHTYLFSLGAFGHTEKMPSGDELALITMCGHGLIAKNRVRHLVQSIKKGELTPEDAAEDIARPCTCGIGNRERARELFARLAGHARQEWAWRRPGQRGEGRPRRVPNLAG